MLCVHSLSTCCSSSGPSPASCSTEATDHLPSVGSGVWPGWGQHNVRTVVSAFSLRVQHGMHLGAPGFNAATVVIPMTSWASCFLQLSACFLLPASCVSSPAAPRQASVFRFVCSSRWWTWRGTRLPAAAICGCLLASFLLSVSHIRQRDRQQAEVEFC